jgi:hypothetical protein
MRSGLRTVAISCNNSTYCSPFAALVDARAPSESASEASNALKKADSMQENEFRGVGVLRSSPFEISANFVLTAFYELRLVPILRTSR